MNGQGTLMLDEMSSTAGHTRPGNDYQVPSSYEVPSPYEVPSAYEAPCPVASFADDIYVVQEVEEPVYANI